MSTTLTHPYLPAARRAAAAPVAPKPRTASPAVRLPVAADELARMPWAARQRLQQRLAAQHPSWWDPDRLRAAHAAYQRGERDTDTVTGEREYQRRHKRARRRGVPAFPAPAPPPARPPLPPRRPGDPSWNDEQLRRAHLTWQAGIRTPQVQAMERFYNALLARRRRSEAARRGRDAALTPGALALVEDVTTLLEGDEGWQAVCRRTGRSPQALERALHRAGRGDLITALKARDGAGGGVHPPRRPAARPPPTSA